MDNLTRDYLRDDTLEWLVHCGIRGVTANPSIFAKAIEGSDAYDDDFAAAMASGQDVDAAYWALVASDVTGALRVLRPTFEASGGVDGFVSVEIAPELAHDTAGSVQAARALRQCITAPNLYVKVPATPEGIPAIRTLVGEGQSINITLLFSLGRYAQVIEAYLSGLEHLAGQGTDLAGVSTVASFFVSRVDTEVDRRLEADGSAHALALRGRAAIAQARVAYATFQAAFAGERWDRLAARGARPQRLLWASTSTKHPDYPDTRYVDALIGPDTVNTLTEATIAAFEDHGTLQRSIDLNIDEAFGDLVALKRAGIDLDDVGRALEEAGVARFLADLEHLRTVLTEKAARLAAA